MNRGNSPDAPVKQEVGKVSQPSDVHMVTPPRLKMVKTEPPDLAVQQKEQQRELPASLEMGSDDSQHSDVSSMESDMDVVSSQESKVEDNNTWNKIESLKMASRFFLVFFVSKCLAPHKLCINS